MSGIIRTDAAPAPVGAYPHARRVGDLLFLSGVGPRQPGNNAIPGNVHDAGGELVGYDIEAQCRQVFANVRAVLEASGAAWNDLVDVTVFLTDMHRDFATYNRLYAEYFAGVDACRTTLGITALPTPIAIELKCIAAAVSRSPARLTQIGITRMKNPSPTASRMKKPRRYTGGVSIQNNRADYQPAVLAAAGQRPAGLLLVVLRSCSW